MVLFNRALRLRDHPALATAARRSERVLPLFVLDPSILQRDDGSVRGGLSRSPNREAFLAESLTDVRAALRAQGAELVVRVGDPASCAVALAREVGAETIHYTEDVTGFARQRQQRLARLAGQAGVSVCAHPGVGVIEAGALTPAGGDHFKVFTPYFRAWSAAPRRPLAAIPQGMGPPCKVDPGPEVSEVLAVQADACSPRRAPGGETAGQRRWTQWRQGGGLDGYGSGHDDLAADATSRLSPYLHFGCLSPLELVVTAHDGDAGSTGSAGSAGAAAFLRQLCWRDFYSQVTAAFPAIAREPYRPRSADGGPWGSRLASGGRAEGEALAAWAAGRTGYPVVDAGMRQLLDEGWMHNRARLLTASFLVKDLGVDWRLGAAHFQRWLTDGDVAQNSANWQWVAGTGNDIRPNRRFNPTRQAERFDPDGRYVRRHVPELDAWAHRSGLRGGRQLHRLAEPDAGMFADRPAEYPEPIVDRHQHAADRPQPEGS